MPHGHLWSWQPWRNPQEMALRWLVNESMLVRLGHPCRIDTMWLFLYAWVYHWYMLRSRYELCRLFLLKWLVANLKFREGFRRASAITAAASANASSKQLLPRASAVPFFWYFFQYGFREHSASFREACGKLICWFTEKQYYFRSKSLGHICKTRKGLVVLEIFKFPYLTCGQYLGWRRYPFRGASASFRGSSANFLQRNGRFL